jgi:hypothetical protein
MKLPVRFVVGAVLSAASAAAQQEGSAAIPDLIGPGGFVVYYDARGPLSFLPMTPRELPPGASILGEVSGEVCEYGISVPLTLSYQGPAASAAYGRGGYEDALRSIRQEHPELTGVFDVRVDHRVTSVLGILRRLCTELVARGFRVADGAPASRIGP